MERAERRWGVPVHVQMATFYQESRFVGDARPPHVYTARHHPDGPHELRLWVQPGARRHVGGIPARDRAPLCPAHRYRRRLGFHGLVHDPHGRAEWHPAHDARNQYLAYHEGHAGYRRGSYNAKPWLLRVADSVADRAATYEMQLISCGRI
jgi:hypothetical protein